MASIGLAENVHEICHGQQEIFAGGAPDVHFASPESKSRAIVIEQIRSLEHALQMRASDGRRKVAVISEADRMLTQAQARAARPSTEDEQLVGPDVYIHFLRHLLIVDTGKDVCAYSLGRSFNAIHRFGN